MHPKSNNQNIIHLFKISTPVLDGGIECSHLFREWKFVNLIQERAELANHEFFAIWSAKLVSITVGE